MSDTVLETTLKFLEWQTLYEEERPFQVFINIPEDAEDKRDTNLVFEDVKMRITDIRLTRNDFHLDNNGFEFLDHVSKVTNFTNKKVVDENYLPEIEELLRSTVDDVDRVFFFDWRLRRNEPEIEGAVIDLNDVTNWLRPALHVHVDQSPVAALNRINLQLGEDADFLLRGRIRIINAWRPLIAAVKDWPLAVCDGSTVDKADLVECDHIRRHYMGSTMYLMKNPKQRFYYMSDQGKDNVLLMKQFDSHSKVKAKFAPHASFRHPKTSPNEVPRASIEVRAFVFTYPKEKCT